MRSKAVLMGHPLHPMLIPFPFAFLTGAALADAAAWLMGETSLWVTGGYLAAAGVATGLLAAAPGIVDYRMVVPPESSARRRATRHLLANVSALTLFAAAWLLRGPAPSDGAVPVLLLEAAGVVLLGMGGWLGGTLVYRNQIAIDHRYAGAGKWRETVVDDNAGGDLRVGRAGELEVDQMKLLRVNGRRLVLARTEQGYVAFDDRCTHRGGSLAGGVMICGTVQCPWHGSQFDVRSGQVKAGPATEGIRTYPVRLSADGDLLLQPGGRDASAP